MEDLLSRHPTMAELEKRAYRLGETARKAGMPVTDNPYWTLQPNLARKWQEGHNSLNLISLFAVQEVEESIGA